MASVIPKFFWISVWTFGVAVAVKAIIGTSSIALIIGFNLLYSGRKSCPHSEIQCASSIAKNEMVILVKKFIFSCLVNDSGATYNNLVNPLVTSFFTLEISPLFKEEFKKWATPSLSLTWRMASTWFFINAISGDTTIAVPLDINAGSW